MPWIFAGATLMLLAVAVLLAMVVGGLHGGLGTSLLAYSALFAGMLLVLVGIVKRYI